jgi:hypothetical protein
MNKRDQHSFIRAAWHEYRALILGVLLAIMAVIFVAVVHFN